MIGEHKDRFLKGYRVIFRPEHFHHTLNKKGYNGWVYEHRYVVEVNLGRALSKSEIVHHIDGNKLNNDISNLAITTRANHAHIHLGKSEKKFCVDCGIEITNEAKARCSRCSRIASRKVKNRPSKDELLKLLETSSFCAVGRMYGVSDNTIRKWIK